jgi:hypothetical protein
MKHVRKIESDLIRNNNSHVKLKAVLSGDGIGPEVILQAKKLCMPSGLCTTMSLF